MSKPNLGPVMKKGVTKRQISGKARHVKTLKDRKAT